jgi:WD40 repeat protein
MSRFTEVDTDILAYYVPAVLVPDGRYSRIRELVTSADYLAAKLARLGPEELLADVRAARLLAPDPGAAAELRVIETALAQAARVLRTDPAQLRGQLLARIARGVAADIDALLEQAAAWRGGTWLQPLNQVPSFGYTASFGPVRGFIDALAISDDGSVVLAGDRSGGLHAWDLRTGELLWQQSGGAPVNAVVFRPSSYEALVALDDGTVGRWGLSDRRLRRWFQLAAPVSSLAADSDMAVCGSGTAITASTLAADGPLWQATAHEAYVSAVAVLGDGRCAAGSFDGSISVWGLADGRLLGRFPLGADRVLCAAAVPGTSLVAVGTRDRLVIIFDVDTGQLTILRGHKNQVRSIAPLADGRLASGSYDGQVLVWDLLGQRSHRAGSHTTWCLAVAAPRRPGPLASGSDDGVVRVWDARGQEAPQLRNQDVRALAVAGDRAFAAVDRVITCRDLGTRRELPALTGHRRPVVTLAVTAAGRLVSGSYDRTLRLWDLVSGETAVLKGHTSGVDAVAVTPEGQEIISVSRDGTWRRWDAATGAPGPVARGAPFNSVLALSPDGTTLVTAGLDHALGVWNRETGRLLLPPLAGHQGYVERLAITPDGGRLLSASWDRSLRVWNLATGEQLRVFEHPDWVVDLAMAPGGRQVLTACRDGRIRRFDVAWLEFAGTIDGHTGGTDRIALTPDGRTVFSTGADRCIRSWDLATGSLLAVFQADLPLRELATSEHGVLAAGTSAGSVLLLTLMRAGEGMGRQHTAWRRSRRTASGPRRAG